MVLACGAANATTGFAQESLGVFEGQADVGTLLHAGSGKFDAASDTYTLTGSGENIWAQRDDFHFVWKKVSGDLTLAADIALAGTEGDHHRKAVLMVRQSLDPDAAYADIAIHGDGLTSLQFRDSGGAPTHEIESSLSAPKRVRIQKQGDQFYMWLAPDGHTFQFGGGSIRVPLGSSFYVGIGVCAHNKDNVQTVNFSHVELKTGGEAGAASKQEFSTLQTITVASTDARVAYVGPEHLDSASWNSDGQTLLVLINGRAEMLTLPGGNATPYSGEMPENFGQEHSPDGQFVFMSSNRSGTMQIWRSAANGTGSVQVTHDASNNASPHISPDGKYLAFVSYPGQYAVLPDNQEVSLKVLSLTDNQVKTLAKINGGRSSLGAQPWSPDSKKLVFVSYQQLR